MTNVLPPGSPSSLDWSCEMRETLLCVRRICIRLHGAQRGFDSFEGIIGKAFGFYSSRIAAIMLGDDPIEYCHLTCVPGAGPAHEHMEVQTQPLPERQLAVQLFGHEPCGFFTRKHQPTSADLELNQFDSRHARSRARAR